MSSLLTSLRSILLSRQLAYGVVSHGLTAIVISNSWNRWGAFYPAAVAIGRSWLSCVILLNSIAHLLLLFSLLLKRLFFGAHLRAIELEHLSERSWFFLTESLMALAIFRDELDVRFAGMLAGLYVGKCGGWIAADRVDYMDQIPPPGASVSYTARLASALTFILAVDSLAVKLCIDDFKRHGSGGVVLFACEFALLAANLFCTSAKLLINVVDQWKAGGREDAPVWERKSMYNFYVDLTYNLFKLAIYAFTFYTIFLTYGMLPLNHVHALYGTIRAFLHKLRDLHRYRTATRDMGSKYPDATADEIQGLGGGSCVICREEMVLIDAVGQQQRQQEGPNMRPKKLPCGHVFHFHCLRSWLERQQSCPTCRRSVFEAAPAAVAGSTAAAAPAPGATPTVAATPTPTPTAGNVVSTGARAPTGPLGIWGNTLPTASSFWHNARPRGGADRITIAQSTSSVPITPTSAAVTPLASQAPTVFSAFQPDQSLRPPVLQTGSTPAQAAAAAALRRLQGIADGNETNQVLYQAADSKRRMPFLEPLYGVLPWTTISLSPPPPEAVFASLSQNLEELRATVNIPGRPTSEVENDLAKMAEIEYKVREMMGALREQQQQQPSNAL